MMANEKMSFDMGLSSFQSYYKEEFRIGNRILLRAYMQVDMAARDNLEWHGKLQGGGLNDDHES